MRRRVRRVWKLSMTADRIGLGWRAPLAAATLANLDRIDVVELIAEDAFVAPRAARRALRTLAAQVPVVVHGLSLGLASAASVAPLRLDASPGLWTTSGRSSGPSISPSCAPAESRSAAGGAAAIRPRSRARRAI
jgi:hypothetical protein